jgi:hypothetical protein
MDIVDDVHVSMIETVAERAQPPIHEADEFTLKFRQVQTIDGGSVADKNGPPARTNSLQALDTLQLGLPNQQSNGASSAPPSSLQ